MRATLLTAAAAAALLASAPLGDCAEAMTFFGASALHAAAADTALRQEATVICGSNGCARVHTSHVLRRPRP